MKKLFLVTVLFSLFMLGCKDDPVSPPVPDPINITSAEIILDDINTNMSHSFYWRTPTPQSDTLFNDTIVVAQGSEFLGSLRFFSERGSAITEITDSLINRRDNIRLFYEVEGDASDKITITVSDLDDNVPQQPVGLNFEMHAMAIGAGTGKLKITVREYQPGGKVAGADGTVLVEMILDLVLN
jgi:hypothetical protein